MQRTGDNILALTQGIISEDYLADASIRETSGSLVFFDFLGAFVIRWPQYIASTVNIAGIIIAGYSVYLNMQSAYKGKNVIITQKQFNGTYILLLIIRRNGYT